MTNNLKKPPQLQHLFQPKFHDLFSKLLFLISRENIILQGPPHLYMQWIVLIQSISIQYVYVILRFNNATFQMFFCPDVVFECRILHILAPKNQHDFETQTDVRYTSSILKNLLRLPFLSTMTALFFTIPTFNALNSKIPYIQVKSMWQHRRQVKLYSFLKMSQSKHEKQLLPIKTGKAA